MAPAPTPASATPASHPRVVLGVAGGIAAYKACLLLRLLTESGHDVVVVPTEAALQFVGRTTWEALSGHPVHTEVWPDAHQVPHVGLGRSADLVIVAPATADLLARAASGRADDLLTNVLLTATGPVLMAPAMHTEMWQHPATQANVATLRQRGVWVAEPASGRLTGTDTGPGRLPEPAELFALAQSLLSRTLTRDLTGLRVLVSAGGTREPLDPVRFLGNASSGRMGVAVARAAALRGAEVTLVAAHLEVDPPSGVRVVPVRTAADLARVMAAEQAPADVVLMAAAVADFTPRTRSEGKIKKSGDGGLELDLVQTVDVLAALGRSRAAGQTLVGFAAETASADDAGAEAELLDLGRAKRERKGCDLLVLNDVSGGAVFGAPDNTVFILGPDAPRPARFSGSKAQLAHDILDAVLANRAAPPIGTPR